MAEHFIRAQDETFSDIESRRKTSSGQPISKEAQAKINQSIRKGAKRGSPKVQNKK